MPKHDFTPAKTPEYLEGFLAYLEDKISNCSDKGELERLWRVRKNATIEHIVSLYIANALLKVKLQKG